MRTTGLCIISLAAELAEWSIDLDDLKRFETMSVMISHETV